MLTGTEIPSKKLDITMFCICSNKALDDIMATQRDIPLPFEEMLECYTSCRTGCGSCIDELRARVEAEALMVNENCEE